MSWNIWLCAYSDYCRRGATVCFLPDIKSLWLGEMMEHSYFCSCFPLKYFSCPSLTPPHHTHNTYSLCNALLLNHSFNKGFKSRSLIYQLCRILFLLLSPLKQDLVLLVHWCEGKNWNCFMYFLRLSFYIKSLFIFFK